MLCDTRAVSIETLGWHRRKSHEFEEFRDIEDGECNANEAGHREPLLIMKSRGCDRRRMRPPVSSSHPLLAATFRTHSDSRPYGEGDDDVAVSPKDKHRRAVLAMSFSSGMHNNVHTQHACRHGAEKAVRYLQIESCQPARCWHRNPRLIRNRRLIYAVSRSGTKGSSSDLNCGLSCNSSLSCSNQPRGSGAVFSA